MKKRVLIGLMGSLLISLQAQAASVGVSAGYEMAPGSGNTVLIRCGKVVGVSVNSDGAYIAEVDAISVRGDGKTADLEFTLNQSKSFPPEMILTAYSTGSVICQCNASGQADKDWVTIAPTLKDAVNTGACLPF